MDLKITYIKEYELLEWGSDSLNSLYCSLPWYLEIITKPGS